jgi:hypothetical protein
MWFLALPAPRDSLSFDEVVEPTKVEHDVHYTHAGNP